MNKLQKIDRPRAHLTNRAATALTLGAAALASNGFAQADNSWDLSGVQTTVSALIVVGVAITLALRAFKVGKRAANSV